MRRFIVVAMTLCVVIAAMWMVAACAAITLPQSVPACVAYGASVTISGGKVSPSAGCIETAPMPGQKEPA